MDYCPGGSLHAYIVKNKKLSEPLAAYLFEQIASAIACCHSHGVSHRDLKPENIFISKFPHIKVSDLGLCGVISHNDMMSTFCGSPCYCAPECLAHLHYDGRMCDVWSLGVVLFAMVTGSLPWTIANTSAMLRQILTANYAIPPHVSPKCRDLIQRMLVKDPSQRLSLERVLAHPWMGCAQKCPHAFAGGALPPRARSDSWTFAERAAETANGAPKVEGGIISPFRDGLASEPESQAEGERVSMDVIEAKSSRRIAISSHQSGAALQVKASRKKSVARLPEP
jgi:serine/threonine protein kinase